MELDNNILTFLKGCSIIRNKSSWTKIPKIKLSTIFCRAVAVGLKKY